jgi:hypothetical protein
MTDIIVESLLAIIVGIAFYSLLLKEKQKNYKQIHSLWICFGPFWHTY